MEKEEEKMASEFVKDLANMLLSKMGKLEQRRQFVLGVAFGLFYGIIGNMVVAHYYGLFESLTVGKYNDLFRNNLIALVLALAVVIFLTKQWYNKLKTLETWKSELKKDMETLEKMYSMIKKEEK